MTQIGPLQMQHTLGIAALLEGDISGARSALSEASHHANQIARALHSAGADVVVVTEKPRPERFDLSELAALDSEAGRELLTGIESLRLLAERYDAERGQTVAGSGTDFGEALHALEIRLRRQVQGAKGRD
ncbi:hypothetical protein [Armatimonas sp.]|uniref:hypothetical protein n=1 Tax=Armatimonas sp. TaxID=1872638 RepID=UPI00374DC417